jgi:Holliday junction DNA helicase RuvA
MTTVISRLIGLLESTGDEHTLFGCQGAGHLVFCSERTLAALPATGEKVSIHVETVVRQYLIRLSEFAEVGVRTCFNKLVGLQGLGARVALSILSALSIEGLEGPVVQRDTKAIGKAHGAGRRLATRIISDLDGKARKSMEVTGLRSFQQSVGNGMVKSSASVALSALTNQGYARKKVLAALRKTVSAQGDGLPTKKLIWLSLNELAS